jgi:signal transduction histidine kinase
VDVLPAVLAATDATELFGALLLANAYARRRDDVEYGLAALLCVAAAAHTTAAIVGLGALGHPGLHEHDAAGIAAGQVGVVGLLLSLALLLHFTLLYARNPRGERRQARQAWRTMTPSYGLVAALAVIENVYRPAQTDRYAVWLSPNGLATYASVFAAATATLVLVARAYLAGQRGTLAVVLGATILLAAVINDIGVAVGAFSTVYLTDLGLAAFIVGIATTPGANFAIVAQERDRMSEELRTRSRELRRSYEELRAAQEELVKKEQLAVVGELAAVIAHEVRNPLAIIANAGAGLRKQAITREDHDTLLAILDEETSRLNRLVTDLLRYARPVNVQRSHLPLPDLLERALSLANDKNKIQYELRVEAGEGRIWGDANLLRQVFDNLIDNAVQAMGTGGALTVRVRSVNEGGVEGLAVDIIDTGEGMDTQVRSRALDPFFTTRPSGTGLGLAIVDRIVDAHGGRLGIESRAGEGTTVTVFLPHGVQTEPPPARTRSQRPANDPARLG